MELGTHTNPNGDPTHTRPPVGRRRGRSATHVRIISAGHYVPDQQVTTEEVERRVAENSPELPMRYGLIKAHTGIDTRHYMDDQTQASDLAVEAARRALANAGMAVSDVDLLVWGSASQDLIEPATAHIVAAKLGMRCPVFDVKNACNSFLNGVEIASALLGSGAYRSALLVTGESPSRAIRWQVPSFREFFTCAAGYTMGDAGAAMVLRYDPKHEGIYFQEFRAASDHWAIATLPAGGSKHPRGDEFTYFSGDGNRLRDAFVAAGPTFVTDALAATGMHYDDFARILCHQVTEPFLEVFLRETGIPRDKLVHTVRTFGNIASATIPTQLSIALSTGQLREGDDVMFAGLGGGLSVATILARL